MHLLPQKKEEVLFKDGDPESDLPPERPEPPVKRIKTSTVQPANQV